MYIGMIELKTHTQEPIGHSTVGSLELYYKGVNVTVVEKEERRCVGEAPRLCL